MAVLLFSAKIVTPLPWVRMDALTLSVLWILPFGQSLLKYMSPLQFALAAVPLMMLLSSGWAAGDVSLVAFVQSQLHNTVIVPPRTADGDGKNFDGMKRHQQHQHQDVSSLGAVMAFLYSAYIIIFSIFSPLMGQVFDSYNARGEISLAFFWVAGVGFAVVCAFIIFISTFVPENSCACNPSLPGDQKDAEKEETEEIIGMVRMTGEFG